MVFQIIIPVLIIVLIGHLVGRFKKIDTLPFGDIIVYLCAPSLVFSKLAKTNFVFGDALKVLLAATLIICIGAVISWALIKFSKSRKRGLILPMVTGNTGYIGYPVAMLSFGAIGLSYAIFYDIVVGLFLFSFGVYHISGKGSISEIFKLPLIYAVVIGFMVNYFGIVIPQYIISPLELIGGVTIPLALLLLGYKLNGISVKSYKIAVMASLFKIFGGLLIAYAVCSIFGFSGILRSVILIQASMPSSVMSMILCHKYECDSSVVASVVFLSTVISVVTIPLILWFLV